MPQPLGNRARRPNRSETQRWSRTCERGNRAHPESLCLVRGSALNSGCPEWPDADGLPKKRIGWHNRLTPPDPEELTRAVPATTTAPIPTENTGFPQETALWWYQEDSSQPQNPCGASGCVSLVKRKAETGEESIHTTSPSDHKFPLHSFLPRAY